MINIKKQYLKGNKFIDLFAGIGGFRLCMESLGAECVYSSEWDKYAQRVYEDNFGECPNGDITQIDEEQIPNHDILCAGFPCQAFSISGKLKGFEDNRGILFFDVARIVKHKKPKIVFMENVKNFAKHDEGKTLEIIKSTMENLGYSFFYKVLNASDFGVPQNRERIYMVCFRNDLCVKQFNFPNGFEIDVYLEDMLLDEGEVAKELYVNRNDIFMNDVIDNTYLNKSIRLGTVNKGGQGERIYSVKGMAITLSSNGGGVFSKTGGYLVNGNYRKLDPRECARIMGFPDAFKICDSRNQAYKQFGNSVVIDVLQYVAIEFGKIMVNSDEGI